MPLNYTPLVQMLQHAALKLQYPSITVFTDDMQKIRVKLAAKGYLAIVLEGEYVGKIEKNGTLILYQDKELVSTILSQLNEDPYAFTKAQGLKYGFCCFCGRELTDPLSVAAGYGPICAENFGLPWGEPIEVAPEDVDVALYGTKELQVLGEADQMLRDINNAALDSKIEGIKMALDIIEALAEVEIDTTSAIQQTLQDLITEMEGLKQ
jgi:hypothetical protein